MVKRLVLDLLGDLSEVTSEEIRAETAKAAALFPMADADEAVRLVEAACNVYIPPASALDGEEDHADWLPDRRSTIDWRLWRRYERYLEEEKDWAPAAVYRLDEVTDQILRRLEDPHRGGSWDRRGMVVGHVQSGKTANYTGLICKAADAGYKLVIVLAGIHDSLRSQTQLRLDEGFLGYDTQQRMQFDQTNTRLGVGLLPGVEFYHVNSMTSSAQKGDFKKQVASTANISVGGSDPLLLVVKKNKSILNNLISWITSVQQVIPHGGHKARVPHVPMLVIDDECDHASVNTKDTFDYLGQFDPDVDPTAINGCIRRLLDSFEQTAYVGYTATPFANIFIYKDADTTKFGEDLFPRSFIINLKKSTDYIGATRVFGLDSDPTSGILAEEALPITRTVSDSDAWIPPGHKSTYDLPSDLPASLRKALLSFVLVCSARAARGQTTEHNSMLIHVTRFTAVQAQVAELIGRELAFIKNRLEFGDGGRADSIRSELQQLWIDDFEPTSGSFDPPQHPRVTWDDVDAALYTSTAKMEVHKVNGTAKDALEYFGKPKGVSVIAIGGDKLSRGLTLEGLSVSYYLRASRMYDTLLQMGRWFGYRPGYSDLCRLFTTADLQRWYKNTTLANEELLQQLDEMALVGGSPDEFGLRVRNSPDGLMITAAAKLRNGRKMRLSFSGSISETIVFDRTTAIIDQNFKATSDLVALMSGTVERVRDKTGNYIWSNVPGMFVADFLETFRSHPSATKAQTTVMAQYVRARLAASELTGWTIALLSNPGPPATIGGLPVGCTQRAKFPSEPPLLSGDSYAIRRLVSPSDETIDLTDHERNQALLRTKELFYSGSLRSERKDPPSVPNGPSIRSFRPVTRGLLLLYPLDPAKAELPLGSNPLVGLAVSFPVTRDADTIEYTINNTYWEQELGFE